MKAIRKSIVTSLAVVVLLSACAQMRTPQVSADKPPPDKTIVVEPTIIEPVIEDPMAIIKGDKPLPIAQGALERIDCLSGEEDLHARMALEARGGQVTSFAYYSRWKFQTCSVHLDQRDQKIRWRRTVDGATRVQTPHGSFVIRADQEHYNFEFRNVERMKFCGMYGRINGTMTVKRQLDPPQCTVARILDL
jgi:hypothetical protein